MTVYLALSNWPFKITTDMLGYHVLFKRKNLNYLYNIQTQTSFLRADPLE